MFTCTYIETDSRLPYWAFKTVLQVCRTFKAIAAGVYGPFSHSEAVDVLTKGLVRHEKLSCS